MSEFIPDNIPVTPTSDEPTLSLTDTAAAPVPSQPVVEARSQKLSYALGKDTPGTDALRQYLSSGQEPQLRASMAAKEDIATELEKDNMLRTAGAALGNNMTQEQARAFLDISATKVKNDPSSAFEEAFGKAFASDVLKVSDKAQEPSAQTGVIPEANVLANVSARNQWLQTGYENAQTEYDNQGFVPKVWQFTLGLVPVLPWWRQAQALSERPFHLSNVLPGKTMLDNVQYMHALPFEDMKRQYNAVMASDSLNTSDKLTFAQAMVSFGTSDEFLANAMGVADAITLGSPVVKGAMAIARGGKAVETASEAAKAAEAQKLLPAPEKRLLLTDQRSAEAKAGSDQFTKQSDLFGPQPDQGSFGFMGTTPEQMVPNLSQEAKVGPGKLRAMGPQGPMSESDLRFGHNKDRIAAGMEKSQLPPGVIRDTSQAEQLGLDLNKSAHQASFDFTSSEIPRPSTPLNEPIATPKVQDFKRGAMEAMKATEGEKVPKPEEVVSAQGNVKLGAVLGAVRRILNPIGLGNAEVLKEVPTFANPMGFFQDSKVLSRAYRQQLQPKIEQALTEITGRVKDQLRVKRLTPEQLKIAVDQGIEGMRREYGKRFPDAVQDIVHIPSDKHPANVDTLMFKLGMPDGTVFPTAEKAALFRRDVYQLGEKEAQIIPQGEGYGLGVFRHIDEDTDAVRTAAAATTNRNPLNTMFGGLLGRLRSAEDLFGKFARGQRHVATHASQELRAVIKDTVDETFGKLGRKASREVEDMLKLNRDAANPLNPSQRGAWYQSAGEFEKEFLAFHKKMPTAEQVVAYDAYKRLSDLDWLVRNQSAYRDKAIQGVRQFRFHFKDQEGAPQVSNWFEGKTHDTFPWGIGKEEYDSTIYVYNSATGKGTVHYKFNMPTGSEGRKALNDLIEKEGYKVIQIHDPKTHPLNGIAYTKSGTELQDRVHFVVTNTAESGALSWKQVDYRPGGHSIYTHKWYVAQPQIQMGRKGHLTYLGDNNILNVRTEAEAKKWSEQLDVGRQLLLAGRMDELMTHIDNNLPHTRDQFLDLFRRHDSPMDLHHPIVYKEAGNSTLESTPIKGSEGYRSLVDGTKDPNDLSNFMDKGFLMDRDQVISGVFENPKAGELRLAPAEQLSPYKAINQAMGQALANIWMNDYKTSAVKQWMEEFKHVMKPNAAVLQKHPLYFLYHPQYEDVSSAQYADLVAAKLANAAIRNFVGTETELGKSVNYFKTKLLNTVYNMTGQSVLLDAALAGTKDPVQFMRGVAFHSKLGFFNPAQFFVQAMTMYHSLLLSPQHGLKGFAAAPMLTWLAHNPGMLDTVAGVAAKVGWTKAEFKSMYSDLSRTGLIQVAGEAALRNDAFDPHLFRSTLGHWVMDLGPVFFNEGERLPRMTGFATAWREFKAANPAAKIGDYELAEIMRRADDMSVNMTRASNASWQSGLWSVPMQFFAYNARVMEQVLGSRLSGLERARILAGYSALYGLPIGLGTAVGGVFPAYDAVKQEGFKRGINMNEGALKVATEGLLSMATSWITGKDYNVAQRYGPGNQQALVDVLKGDKPLWEAMFGASGSIIGDVVKSASPLLHNVAGLFIDNGEYPMTSADWLDMARNIATVDLATKAYVASTYGKWITKSGSNVSDADTMDAFMTALGLSPKEATDTFLWLKAIRGQKDAANKIVELAQQQYRLGIQAKAAGNDEIGNAYMKRAHTLIQSADLNAEQTTAAFHRIFQANYDLADRVKSDALRNAPLSNYDNVLKLIQGK